MPDVQGLITDGRCGRSDTALNRPAELTGTTIPATRAVTAYTATAVNVLEGAST
jgi:hypothetical protein